MNKLVNILFWSVISAAFIGPGTVTACITAGAKHQSQLLWALVFATIACIILQEAAARISIASGHNLGTAIKQHFQDTGGQQGLIIALFIAVALGCAAYEAGNILGAVAGFQLVTTLSATKLTALIVLFAAFFLWNGNIKLIANLLGGIVAVMGLAFLILAFQIDLNIGEVIGNGLIPSIPEGSALLVIGLIGTTIVPYNIFLGSGIGQGQTIKEMRFGLSIAILLGGIISMAIMLVGTQLVGEVSFNNMAIALQEVGGEHAGKLLGTGLFAAGLTSAITAPFAAAVTAKTLFNSSSWQAHSMAFKSVWIVVLLIGGVFGVLDVKPIPIIITAQALNGLLLPIITFLLVLLVNNKKILHSYVNNGWRNFTVLLILAISTFLGLLNIVKAIYKIVGETFIWSNSLFVLLLGLSAFVVVLAIWRIKKIA